MLTIENIDKEVLAALHARGHSNEEIREMTPDKAFDVYCAWVIGDESWGQKMRDVQANLKAAASAADAVACRGRWPADAPRPL